MGRYKEIDVVLNDIKELHEMVKGFREEDNIPRFIIKLAENKAQKILTAIKEYGEENTHQEQAEKIAAVMESVQEVKTPIAEVKTETSATIEQPIEKPLEIIAEPIEQKVFSTEIIESQEGVKETEEKVVPITQDKETKISTTEHTAVIDTLSVQSTRVADTINQFLASKESVNDSIEKRLNSDIRKSLSLNDRFRFMRELFGNNQQMMNEVLDDLNNIENLSEALEYLASKFNWDKENQSATDFIKLVIKRLS